jgi:hypothetical protein
MQTSSSEPVYPPDGMAGHGKEQGDDAEAQNVHDRLSSPWVLIVTA